MTKQKKKRSARSVLAFALMYLLGMAGGFLLGEGIGARLAGFATRGERFLWLGVMLAAAVLMVYGQIAIHEAGHLLGGLATGYRFSSYRVGSWMILRENGRLVPRWLTITGTGGQCLMTPPAMVDGQVPYVLYNIGGVLGNLAAALVFGGLWLAARDNVWLGPICLMGAVFGLLFTLANGIPLRMGLVDNDGRNAISLGRDPAALRAFWVQMQINAAQADGKRLREMPDAWFDTAGLDLHNPMTATSAVFACNRLMDAHAFTEADARMTALIDGENAVLGLHRSLLVCDCIWCALMAGDLAHAGALYTAEQKKFMRAMKRYPAVIRTEHARALLYEGDLARAEALEAQFARAAVRYPYPADLAGERELMALAARRREELAHDPA